MKEDAPLSSEQILLLRDAEEKRLAEFPSAPHGLRNARPTGVLLSDEIEFYIEHFKLVDPSKSANIKAASYELRVGKKYAIGNKVFSLSDGGVLTFPKFEVVVVEILETLNLPDFLIGRWNIRTRWAYEGLIWVGGPQVNPGFRGKIMCPLWNLSDKEISIPYGEAIAVMDFATTTPVKDKSNREPHWDKRTRVVFEDYVKDLRSGLVTLVADGVENLKTTTAERLESHQNRMDTFTAVTFSALGVLVAAVAIIGTEGNNHYWWDPTVFWLCSLTAILALFMFLRARVATRTSRWIIIFVALLGIGSIGLQLFHQHTYEQTRQAELKSLTKTIDDVKKQNSELEEQVKLVQSVEASGKKR